jgi:LCP family protein required for cell wall assembly
MDPRPMNLLNPNSTLDNFPEEPRKKRHILAYILFFVILIGGVHLGIQKIASMNQDDSSLVVSSRELTPKKMSIFETVKNFFFKPDETLGGQKNDRINILLLGMGGEGHEGSYLTDTNIIVSIKPSTKEVAMISVPRDLSVKIDNYGTGRINNVNVVGERISPGKGGEFTRQFFSKNFNLDIQYYVRVDFQAFVEIVNTVGGITVDVPNAFTDYSYPGPNYSYQTVSFKQGVQTMDGETALKYSRSRHGGNGEGSDFARSRRQQQVLAALKEKILSAGTYTNPITVTKIYNSLARHLDSNLNIAEMVRLGSLAQELDTTHIKALTLDNSVKGFLTDFRGNNGAYLLRPRSGNFEAINLAINNVFSTDPSSTSSTTPTIASARTIQFPPAPTTASAKIEIQNGTWQMGLANRVKQDLQSNGLTVQYVGNSTKRPIESTMIYLLNPSADNQVVDSLSTQLKAQNTNKPLT